MSKWKTVMTLALFVYCVGLVFFALHPLDSVDWAEWVVAVLGAIAAIGLVGYALPNVTLPGERYAYLMVGWAGFTCMMLYLVDTQDSTYRRSAIALFLLSGAISGYGAHLVRDEVEGL
jgi:hypothetical protein